MADHVVDAPFTPAPPAPTPVVPAPLILGGQLAAIHADLTARLQVAFPPSQFVFQVVPPRLTAADWERLTRKTPTVGLGWAGMEPQQSGQRVWRGVSRWMVLLVTDATTADSAMLGATVAGVLTPGLYGMVSVAGATLHGRDIAGIGSAVVAAGSPIYAEDWTKADKAHAALNVTVPFDLVDAAGLAGLDAFLRSGVAWENLAPLGDDASQEIITLTDQGGTP